MVNKQQASGKSKRSSCCNDVLVHRVAHNAECITARVLQVNLVRGVKTCNGLSERSWNVKSQVPGCVSEVAIGSKSGSRITLKLVLKSSLQVTSWIDCWRVKKRQSS